ncbi:hypothetical protein BD780_003947 [Clostridium tetanomorphum]|uniref:MetS family NSS transporter small subunit n=1 Tax=Clostridium tetanomorphum TaxID=1553 RepID=A0A923EE90_CLOTT|nr:MetS family NSS transporter small subunit [Clostridium tetanomorphum]MBC2399290.1 MetS family NSS transporter small subunit [Clostridium tetanomorphum]MBP1866094.1 hypothetical protein [Clostridium tetanomorphum]NRS86722.1 hypothetical protein [Clostridium tetanomorphum]NRZ99525.1 hypothetical protein [Clostridium tetanomorphum]SQC00489.1 Uncharacterised protein [Clostridium tetanomorphum]
METSSITMLIFGIILLYGGLAYFIYRAIKAEKEKN